MIRFVFQKEQPQSIRGCSFFAMGWLLDPGARRVYVYRPDAPIEVPDNVGQISGGPLLPGFVFDLREIREPGF